MPENWKLYGVIDAIQLGDGKCISNICIYIIVVCVKRLHILNKQQAQAEETRSKKRSLGASQQEDEAGLSGREPDLKQRKVLYIFVMVCCHGGMNSYHNSVNQSLKQKYVFGKVGQDEVARRAVLPTCALKWCLPKWLGFNNNYLQSEVCPFFFFFLYFVLCALRFAFLSETPAPQQEDAKTEPELEKEVDQEPELEQSKIKDEDDEKEERIADVEEKTSTKEKKLLVLDMDETLLHTDLCHE
ncbi:hypothetical protein RFI_27558, partial [Reticulomyxa filosa]